MIRIPGLETDGREHDAAHDRGGHVLMSLVSFGTKRGAPESGREESRGEVCQGPGVARSVCPSSFPALPRPVESPG